MAASMGGMAEQFMVVDSESIAASIQVLDHPPPYNLMTQALRLHDRDADFRAVYDATQRYADFDANDLRSAIECIDGNAVETGNRTPTSLGSPASPAGPASPASPATALACGGAVDAANVIVSWCAAGARCAAHWLVAGAGCGGTVDGLTAAALTEVAALAEAAASAAVGLAAAAGVHAERASCRSAVDGHVAAVRAVRATD